MIIPILQSGGLGLRGTWKFVQIIQLVSGQGGEGDGTPLQYSCLEIPWMEEPGRLQSMGSRRVGYN